MRQCPSPRSGRRIRASPSSMLLSLPARLLASLAVAQSPSLWGASAFVLSPGNGASVASTANRHIIIDPTRCPSGVLCKTSLLAEATGDDKASDAPKAVNKGEQPKKASAKSSAKAKGKSKSTRRAKGTQKLQKQQRRRPTKKPLEISAQSLTPSQTNSEAVQRQPSDNEDDGEQNYAYNIPKGGYSLADQLENQGPENRERFETTLTPIVAGIQEKKEVEFQYDEEGFPVGFREAAEEEEEEKEGRRHQGVARIDTVSTLGTAGEEPVRWLVSLGEAGDGEKESYAMIDVPPYSDGLANEMRSFMDPTHNATASDGTGKASLDTILVTNQQCIHYDASPGVYITRQSDLKKWRDAFPDVEVVMYRLDVPRECREEVTQVLDGYGPWGWDEDGGGESGKFVETGRPLRVEEWDEDTKTRVLNRGELPPDERAEDGSDDGNDDDGDSPYSPGSIRQREEKHRLLAVYTPGHTFGSVTYIFPQRGICCSGHTLPLESAAPTEGDEDGSGSVAPASPQGPRLDYQGYLATSASRPRQMSSASSLINQYIDRFRVVLPARGDLVLLDAEEEARKRELMESVGLYRKMSEIYGRLGIVE